ncbi:MAG: mechanosensitive ion channel family protein [Magnetococcales bacterium]|nr:mechanosensitive ion channel family protein [Magnetococcales bacterium]
MSLRLKLVLEHGAGFLSKTLCHPRYRFIGLGVILSALMFILYLSVSGFGLLFDHVTEENRIKFFKIILWMTAAFVLNRVVRKNIWNGVVTRRLGYSPPALIINLSAILVYFCAIVGISVDVYQKSVVHFLTASGVVGIVLGFALQKIIADIFSGLAINIDPSFRLHDWVLLHGRNATQNIFGCVKEINWRTTRIQTEENVMVVIPNSVMATSIVSNYQMPDEKTRFSVFLYLDFAVPIERAIRVIQSGILQLAGKEGFLDSPAPKTLVSDIAESGIKYCVTFWLLPSKTFPDVGRHQAITSILESLAKSGITPMLPKQETILARNNNAGVFDFNLPQYRRQLLSRQQIFTCLHPEEVSELSEKLLYRTFHPGEIVFKKGDAGSSMFLLVEGIADVVVETSESTPKGNKINRIKSGEIFGEMALFTGEKRSATLSFPTSAIVYELTKESFQPILEKRPELAKEFGLLIAKRKMEMSEFSDRLRDADADIACKGGLIESMINTYFNFMRGPDRRSADPNTPPYPPEKERRKSTDRRSNGTTAR